VVTTPPQGTLTVTLYWTDDGGAEDAQRVNSKAGCLNSFASDGCSSIFLIRPNAGIPVQIAAGPGNDSTIYDLFITVEQLQ
jgi:hypothetical protein